MPTGDNITNFSDKLIKKTTDKGRNTGITHKRGQPSETPGTATYKTIKKTLYIRDDLLRKINNYAKWEWISSTEALNRVILDGLKGKKTKDKE